MKKLLLALAFVGFCFAQDPLIYVSVDPTDGVTPCSANSPQVEKGPSGNLWACDLTSPTSVSGGVWRKVNSSSTVSVTFNNGLTASPNPVTGSGTASGVNAAADGATKGVAAFTAADFNSSSGVISTDYTNGQKATSSVPGYATSNQTLHSFGASFNGNGSALTTGNSVAFIVPYSCIIAATNIALNAADTATFKVWKVATGSAIPTSGNSINTSGISISSGTNSRSTTTSDFTSTAVTANDIIIVALTAIGGTATWASFIVQCNAS